MFKLKTEFSEILKKIKKKNKQYTIYIIKILIKNWVIYVF